MRGLSGLVLPPHPPTPLSRMTFGGSVWVRARTASSKRTVSFCWYLHCSEQIRGRIYLSRGKLSWVDHLARVLAWYERAPGFESRSGIVLCYLFHDQLRCRSHRNKYHHSGFGASIQEESQSWCQNHPGVVPRIVTYFV